MSRAPLVLGAQLLGARVHATVDRLEDGFAVVELHEDAFIDVPLALLPPAVREGDRLVFRRRRGHTRVRLARLRRTPAPSLPRPAPQGTPNRRLGAPLQGESHDHP